MPRCTLAASLAFLTVASAFGKSLLPLDVSGDYNSVRREHCWCRQSQGHTCNCAQPGCEYVEQLSLTQPSPEGIFKLTTHAASGGCYSGSSGPYMMEVDRCGAVFSGGRWNHSTFENTSFDPSKKDQEIDLMIAGNILGFGGAPAGFQHTIILRQNITICGTQELLDGRCTPGEERLICFEKFAYCAQGNCATKNRQKLSPLADSFSPPVTSTGLNGTYQLSVEDSSERCPSNISVYQFGTQIGLGWAQNDMRMARLSAWLPDKDARHECVSFFTQCDGLQFQFERAHVGNFARDKNNKYVMTMFDVLPVPDSGQLYISKCMFRAGSTSPPLIDIYANQHVTVVILSIFLGFSLLAAGGLGACVYWYRRQYLDTKITRHYDIFQGVGG